MAYAAALSPRAQRFEPQIVAEKGLGASIRSAPQRTSGGAFVTQTAEYDVVVVLMSGGWILANTSLKHLVPKAGSRHSGLSHPLGLAQVVET